MIERAGHRCTATSINRSATWQSISERRTSPDKHRLEQHRKPVSRESSLSSGVEPPATRNQCAEATRIAQARHARARALQEIARRGFEQRPWHQQAVVREQRRQGRQQRSEPWRECCSGRDGFGGHGGLGWHRGPPQAAIPASCGPSHVTIAENRALCLRKRILRKRAHRCGSARCHRADCSGCPARAPWDRLPSFPRCRGTLSGGGARRRAASVTCPQRRRSKPAGACSCC